MSDDKSSHVRVSHLYDELLYFRCNYCIRDDANNAAVADTLPVPSKVFFHFNRSFNLIQSIFQVA